MKALAVNVISRMRIGPARQTAGPWVSTRLREHGAGLALLSLGCLAAAVPLFYLGLFRVIATDHDVHVRFIQRGIDAGVWPVHFLFPAIVYALSGFSHDFTSLAGAALVFLTLCVLAKAWLTYWFLARSCPRLPGKTFEDAYGLSHATVLALVAGALLLSAPVVRPWWVNRVYLGQISPNVWHNPTSVVCWPIVILLFFAADAFLRSAGWRMLTAVAALSAVSVLAKPNYFLAFAPVFALLGLRRFGISRAWILSLLAMLPTVLVLWWQWTASFAGPNAMRSGMHIAWMPLAAWHVHSRSIPLSVLFSLAFPLSYLVVFRRSLQNRELLWFAWGVLLSALVWTSCFAEVRNADGAVDFDFNFSWGAHLSLFVLFLATAIDLLDNPQAMNAIGGQAASRRLARLPWWLLGTHAASGTYWIVRQAIGRTYR